MRYHDILIGLACMNISLIGMDSAPTVFLTKEIIHYQIMPRITLQEMSRLKSTCKIYNGFIDTEKPFPLVEPCHFYSLKHLFDECHYDVRTKVLVHYAKTKNGAMFDFLWNQEKDLRDIDTVKIFKGELWQKNKMQLYGNEYSTLKKIQKVRVTQIWRATHYGKNNLICVFLKKILPNSGFNIFNVKYCARSKYSIHYSWNYVRSIFKAVCEFEDVDLLLAIVDGIIEPRALKYIFYYSEKLFIESLRAKEAFVENVPDKYGRYFAYYMCHHVPPSIRNYPSGGGGGGGIR